jgi:acyl carrier protein
MTNEEIESIVKRILAEDFELDVSSLKPESNLFTELDLDSIDAVDLVVRLQQEIGRKVDPESFKKIRTFGDVVSAISGLVNG